MPLVFEKTISPAKKAAVWEITEPYEFFSQKLSGTVPGVRSEKRLLEQACSKLLMNYLNGSPIDMHLENDMYGKPVLKNLNMQVSFSHCRAFVACLLDFENQAAGIDIERIRPNISELSKKFISETDSTALSGNAGQQLIWGAKEVLYKIHGKKELDFKRDLHTEFSRNFVGHILKNGIRETYPLGFEIFRNEFIIVWNT